MLTPLRRCGLALTCVLLVPAHAQTAATGTGGGPAPAATWTQVESAYVAGAEAGTSSAALAAANQAAAYYQQNPASANVPEAREQELLLLIQAAELGDQSQQSRRTTLLSAFQSDQTVPVHLRFVASSMANALAIDQTPALTAAGRLAAYTQSARQMIAAYPSEPEPYESLAAIADDATDGTGPALAQEVLQMAGAPAEAKARAQAVVNRAALVGHPFNFDFAGAAAPPSGKVVVLYVWTSAMTKLAGLLQTAAGPNVVFLGVNFDADSAAGQAAAAALPGSQVYDRAGLLGPIARELWLTEMPAIYLIDQTGVLRDVQGLPGLAGKVAALTGKAAS